MNCAGHFYKNAKFSLTDVDAFVIAGKLRFGRASKEGLQDDYRYKALQALTRARFYAV